MADEPTLGEIMRRLDATMATLSELAIQMRDDRNHAATTYVRRDWLDEARKADRADVVDVGNRVTVLSDDKKRDADFRRQASLAFAVLVVGFLGSSSLAVVSLLSGGA